METDDMIMCEIESSIALYEMRRIVLLDVGRKERSKLEENVE